MESGLMAIRVNELWDQLDPRRSLRSRLALATIGMGLSIATLLSAIGGYLSATQLRAAAHRSLEELAFQIADKLDRGMFERYRDLQILANLDAIRQPDDDLDAKRTLLETLQKTYPNYAWLGLTDADGKVLASTGGLLEGQSAAQRPWFQVGQTQPFVGDVHEALLLEKLLSNPTGEPLRFVDVATPVLDKQGQLQGVLSAHLSWEWAKEVTETLLAPQSERSRVEILVLSQDGTVLLGPPSLQGEILPLVVREKSRTRRSGYFVEAWPSQGKFVTGFASTQGYLSYPGLGWIVLVRQPFARAIAPAHQLQVQVFGWGLLFGGLFSVLGWLSARRVSLAMSRLAATADRIQGGHSDVAMPHLRGRDEVAQLASSLGHMVETLQAQQQELRANAQQLHTELQERRRAEGKVREQAALLDIATDAIFVRDLSHCIQYWNHGACKMYGWTEEEAQGQNAMSLLNPVSTPQLEAACRAVLEEGEWRGELEKVTRTGQKLLIESRWTLARDEEDFPTFILTVDTDITEQKQLEAQFLRAQRLESLGTLASGIAHDLNNIFTPIMGSAKLLPLCLDPSDEKSRRLATILDSSAKRGSDLVKQILTFARGAEGDFASIQVSDVIAEIEQIIRSTFSKSIEVRVISPSEPMQTIFGNATQLHQVLMNLCVNARDAMPQGGLLTVSARECTADSHFLRMHPEARVGRYIAIEVSDTGTGMPAEIRDRIFDPFFTTKELGEGTGLGLSTVRGIIKTHGGFISVYSEMSRGTTFKVFLPIKLARSTENSTPELLREGRGEMVLIVDDEVLILEVTKTALELNGFKVLIASDSKTALSLYEKHQSEIDIALIDIMMPKLDGLSTITSLKSINSHLKIVATSGLMSNITLAPDIDAFLPKPYTISELVRVLNLTLSA